MALQLDAQLGNMDAFAFEELFLKGSVRLAYEDFPVFADDAMPRYALTGGRRCHRAACAARAATETQNSSYGPVG